MSVLERFLASGKADDRDWRDGPEYDVALIGKMTAEERLEAERHLLAKPLPELHEMRAIAVLGSAKCVGHLEWFAAKGSPMQKLNAVSSLEWAGKGGDMKGLLAEIVPKAIEGGDTLFSRVMDQVGWTGYVEAIPLLMEVVERGPGRRASLCGALVLYLKGKATERLAMEHRPLWLKLNVEVEARGGAVEELKRVAGMG